MAILNSMPIELQPRATAFKARGVSVVLGDDLIKRFAYSRLDPDGSGFDLPYYLEWRGIIGDSLYSSTPTLIAQGPFPYVMDEIVVNTVYYNGDPYVLVGRNTTKSGTVFDSLWVYYRVGGTWTAVQVASSVGPGNDITINANGMVLDENTGAIHITYDDLTQKFVFYATFSAGLVATTNIWTLDPTYVGLPGTIDLSPDGDVHIAFMDDPGGPTPDPKVYWANDIGGWSVTQVVGGEISPLALFSVGIKVDRDGFPWLLINRTIGGIVHPIVRHLTSFAPVTWTDEFDLYDASWAPAVDNYFVSLVFDNSDRIWAMAMSDNPAAPDTITIVEYIDGATPAIGYTRRVWYRHDLPNCAFDEAPRIVYNRTHDIVAMSCSFADNFPVDPGEAYTGHVWFSRNVSLVENPLTVLPGNLAFLSVYYRDLDRADTIHYSHEIGDYDPTVGITCLMDYKKIPLWGEGYGIQFGQNYTQPGLIYWGGYGVIRPQGNLEVWDVPSAGQPLKTAMHTSIKTETNAREISQGVMGDFPYNVVLNGALITGDAWVNPYPHLAYGIGKHGEVWNKRGDIALMPCAMISPGGTDPLNILLAFLQDEATGEIYARPLFDRSTGAMYTTYYNGLGIFDIAFAPTVDDVFGFANLYTDLALGTMTVCHGSVYKDLDRVFEELDPAAYDVIDEDFDGYDNVIHNAWDGDPLGCVGSLINFDGDVVSIAIDNLNTYARLRHNPALVVPDFAAQYPWQLVLDFVFQLTVDAADDTRYKFILNEPIAGSGGLELRIERGGDMYLGGLALGSTSRLPLNEDIECRLIIWGVGRDVAATRVINAEMIMNGEIVGRVNDGGWAGWFVDGFLPAVEVENTNIAETAELILKTLRIGLTTPHSGIDADIVQENIPIAGLITADTINAIMNGYTNAVHDDWDVVVPGDIGTWVDFTGGVQVRIHPTGGRDITSVENNGYPTLDMDNQFTLEFDMGNEDFNTNCQYSVYIREQGSTVRLLIGGDGNVYYGEQLLGLLGDGYFQEGRHRIRLIKNYQVGAYSVVTLIVDQKTIVSEYLVNVAAVVPPVPNLPVMELEGLIAGVGPQSSVELRGFSLHSEAASEETSFVSQATIESRMFPAIVGLQFQPGSTYAEFLGYIPKADSNGYTTAYRLLADTRTISKAKILTPTEDSLEAYLLNIVWNKLGTWNITAYSQPFSAPDLPDADAVLRAAWRDNYNNVIKHFADGRRLFTGPGWLFPSAWTYVDPDSICRDCAHSCKHDNVERGQMVVKKCPYYKLRAAGKINTDADAKQADGWN